MMNNTATDFHTAQAALRRAIIESQVRREHDDAEARAFADRVNKRYGVR
jgi:hypothetical protein